MSNEPANANSIHALLGRPNPLRKRVLPPLDQIRRSVKDILSRWPDAIKTPEDRDREKLALNMLFRVQDWKWENITTQRVISAAVAVFDEERRTRSDLAPVHTFYLSEIATRQPGAFLDGMVGVYIDSFEPGASHTRLLAQALGQRSTELGGRHRKLTETLPSLFRPDAAPLDLARIMLGSDDPYKALKSMGLSSPHTSGLAKAAHKTFVERLAPELAKPEARSKLFNWLTPENGPVLQAGAGPAVEALLSVWRNRTPTDALRNELSEQIIAGWNDPRLHNGGIWSGFDPDLKSVLLRWLTHQDMKFFCDMVTATQDSHMWPPRRDFWLKLYDDKMIDEAWVAFGSEARRYAQQNLIRSGKTDMNRRFGRQLDRGSSTSLLIMRIGNKIVVDGCHSYKTHIFRLDDKGAPKLYQREYYCDDIMRASRNSKPHNSIYHWSQWVLQNV
ncbi:EH signature domain-containing protein [Ruegeria aquimaris]|uniref:EH signature domain-containing protein n=1 Tax=Ruegeria aquimaris TaxID=2984333 RepID=A0ABT3APR7_9RHOB|nr:EH signature domain-containing protein [Ruegeria sp. XHP0148]MCV2890668.1 EH signature domain-containing protein [Ruegeria sp. XHP0148]